jgi:hypothetical protein
MFVKFSCGCIGIPPDIVVKTCEDGQLCFIRRKEQKPYQDLPEDEEFILMKQLNLAIIDGYQLKELKRILKGG